MVATVQPAGNLDVISPTGAEMIRVEPNAPQIYTVVLTQLRDASGYTLVAQQSTNVLTLGNVSVLAFHGGSSGTATVTLPPNPVDGQGLLIFSTAGLSGLTITPNTGQTVDNTTTSLAANGNCEYIYSLASATWYRVS